MRCCTGRGDGPVRADDQPGGQQNQQNNRTRNCKPSFRRTPAAQAAGAADQRRLTHADMEPVVEYTYHHLRHIPLAGPTRRNHEHPTTRSAGRYLKALTPQPRGGLEHFLHPAAVLTGQVATARLTIRMHIPRKTSRLDQLEPHRRDPPGTSSSWPPARPPGRPGPGGKLRQGVVRRRAEHAGKARSCGSIVQEDLTGYPV